MREQKGQSSRMKKIIIPIFSVGVLVILSGVIHFLNQSVVVNAVTLEAGTGEIRIEDFLKDKDREGSFVTDIGSLNTNVLGNHEIKIMVGSKIHTSLLEVVDTKAPVFTVTDQLALRGEEVDPNIFVSEVSDATQVTISFEKPVDTSAPGEQEVTIICEDSAGNRAAGKAKLQVLDIHVTVTMEAGSEMKITPEDFVKDSGYSVSFVTDLGTVDTGKPAVYPVELEVGGKSVTGKIEVVDTTPPRAEVKNQQIWKGENIDAKLFLDRIEDVSEVTTAYKEAPDFNQLGKQNIILVLTDSWGNKTELAASVTVREDTEPPVIMGASNKRVYIGDSISYRNGISVSDNKDKNLTFQVDNSKVNLKKEGTYEVTYTAADTSGNKVTKKIEVKVERFVVSEDMLNELCDEVLGKITKKSMSKRETAHAIYKWIKQRIDYSGSSDKSDWMAEAYRGMTNGAGDCFTYFAAAQALLTRAGIDNMEVNRVGGRTRHYWNLINCGEGWYHFDSCPTRDKHDGFMMTDKQTEEYTELRGNNYYTFDRSLYPATPEE